jgi:multiple sugar transport system permease protein
MRARAARLGLYALLAAGAAGALLPTVWMISASFMPAGEAAGYPPRLLPSSPTVEHYATLLGGHTFWRNFLNSVLIAVTVTLLGLLVNSMAGYGLAKLRFRGRRGLLQFLSAALLLPAQAAMLPLFLLLKEMGLVNTYWGVIIPSVASAFGILVIQQYAASLPDDLLDAARVDGASEFRIYWSVVLPVVRPVLATVGISIFVATWNDFMWPLIVLSDSTRYTLPVALANLAAEQGQETELTMAGAVLTALPVLMGFLALQRYYFEGITNESVKGAGSWQA